MQAERCEPCAVVEGGALNSLWDDDIGHVVIICAVKDFFCNARDCGDHNSERPRGLGALLNGVGAELLELEGDVSFWCW